MQNEKMQNEKMQNEKSRLVMTKRDFLICSFLWACY